MAQTIFDALTGSVSVDNQAALVVQSFLDSQNVPEATQQAEEEDLFQCGKCKKQFTSLQPFISHKQGQCTPPAPTTLRPVPQQAVVSSNPTAFTTAIQQQQPNRQTVQTLNAVAQSPLTQLGPGMVLSDDIMAFTSIDPNLQTQTIQMTFPPAQQGTTVQGNPFLSQALTTRGSSANSVTIYSPVTTTTFSANGSAFTTAVPTNQLQIQPHQQQVNLSPIDKTTQPKPSPTKAGRKSAQSLNQHIVNVSDMDSTTQQKSKKGRSGAGQDTDDNGQKKKLRCQYCNKMFNKNFDLQQHVRCHTGEKPFQCIVCGRAFAQKSNVKKHMTTHKVWPAGTGSTLPKPTPTKVVLVEDVESGITQCNSTMTEQGQEPEHNPQPIRELNIGSSTDDSGQMSVIVDNSYLCQYCPEKFKTYFQLKSHMVVHKDEQVYKCVLKTCGSTFKSLDVFLEHIKTHEEGMSYRCHMCNKKFPSLYELGVHQYSHSLYPSQTRPTAPRYYQCSKCLNKYSSPEALDHHLSTASHHYPCPTCQKVFTCERYLRRHLPTHGAIGQFQCGVCFKRFKAESYLKMHSLIHSGVKPFKCDQCEAAFNRKDKLKRHMLIHVTVKKFKCPFRGLTGCEMEFNRPDKLKAHIISHSGIKPYKCRECGKSFSRKPSMLEHERSHRADFRFRCGKCGKGFFRPKLFHGHKCNPITDKDGTLIVPTPRMRNRRKIGRPRKRMITVTPETLKTVTTVLTRRRGRPQRRGAATQVTEASVPSGQEPTTANTSGNMATSEERSGQTSSVVAENIDQNAYSNCETLTQSSEDMNAPGQNSAVGQAAGNLPADQVKDTGIEVAFAGVEYGQVPAPTHLTGPVGYVTQLQACTLSGANVMPVQGGETPGIVTISGTQVVSPEQIPQVGLPRKTGKHPVVHTSSTCMTPVELVEVSTAHIVSSSEANEVEIQITSPAVDSQVVVASEAQGMDISVGEAVHTEGGVALPFNIVEGANTVGISEGMKVRRQVVFTTPGNAPGELVTCVAEIETSQIEDNQGEMAEGQIQHYVSETDPVLQGTESLLKASEEILRSAGDQ